MVAALHSICAMQDWQLDNVLIWVDYCSIPQARRRSQEAPCWRARARALRDSRLRPPPVCAQVCRSVQALAINSLTAYASHAKVFIIVAPEVIHA